MAEFFHYKCQTCTRGFHLFDDGPDTDEVKITRMHCLWCKSIDIDVEPLNEEYQEKHPEQGKPKEGGKAYPLDMSFENFLKNFDPLDPVDRN